MAVTWSITNLEYTNDSDKGVVHAAWSVTDSEVVGEVTHTGTVSGMESYTPDASAEGYVAWDSLDAATVAGWIKDSMGEDAVTALEDSIASQIAESKAPAISTGVPW